MIGITGATGLVGIAILRILVKRGIPTRIITRRPRFSLPESCGDPTVEVIVGDLCDESISRRFHEGLLVLIHCAGTTHPTNYETNLELARTVSEGVVTHRISHLINMSTVGVYSGIDQSTCLRDESSLVEGCNLYEVSKIEVESIFNDLHRKNVGVTHFRCANVFEKSMSNRNLFRLLRFGELGFFPKIVSQPVYFDYISAEDIGILIAEYLKVMSPADLKIYNLSNPLSLDEFVEVQERVFSTKIYIINLIVFWSIFSIFIPRLFIKRVERLLAPVLFFDNSKAKKEIDWIPDYYYYKSLKELVNR